MIKSIGLIEVKNVSKGIRITDEMLSGKPTEEEVSFNNRSRSATLRIAEKL